MDTRFITTARSGAAARAVDAGGALDLWGEAPRGAPRVSLSLVLGFARRHLVWIVVVSGLIAVAVFFATYLVFNKYQATATIIIDPRSPNVTQGAGVLSNIGGDAIAIESIVQVTKSNAFLGALAQRLKLYPEGDTTAREAAIEALGKSLNIGRRGTTYVIDATASDRSAEQSAKIANAAAQAIIDDQRSLRSGADDETVADIGRRLSEVQSRVARAEQAAADLKAELKVTEVGQGATLLERRVFELNQQHVLASAKAAEARARYEQLRRAKDFAGDNLDLAPQSAVLNNLKTQKAALLRQSVDQSTTLGPRHPSVLALNAQLAEINKQIAAEIARMQGAVHNDLLEAEQRESLLVRQLNEAQQESEALGPKLVKLDQLDREAKAERSVYEQLLTRQRELAGTKNLQPSDIHFVSPATPPTRLKPTLPARLGLALALGLLGGLATALLRETLKSAGPKSADASGTFAGLEVLGTSPLVRDRTRSGAVDLGPWLKPLASLVTSARRRPSAHVTLVTSPLGGAGRSSVAAGLAGLLAEDGARVLLVEAGGSPSAEDADGPGLLDVLKSGEDLGGALVESDEAAYTLLPLGGETLSRRDSAGDLMRGVTMRALLKLCRRRYDFVVIDGPAVLEADHTPALARLADLSVLVARADKTGAAEAGEALEDLAAENVVAFMNKSDAEPRRARAASAAARPRDVKRA